MLATAFDGLDDLVYIADLETYDLLYANRACRQNFHIQDSPASVMKCCKA